MAREQVNSEEIMTNKTKEMGMRNSQVLLRYMHARHIHMSAQPNLRWQVRACLYTLKGRFDKIVWHAMPFVFMACFKRLFFCSMWKPTLGYLLLNSFRSIRLFLASHLMYYYRLRYRRRNCTIHLPVLVSISVVYVLYKEIWFICHNLDYISLHLQSQFSTYVT